MVTVPLTALLLPRCRCWWTSREVWARCRTRPPTPCRGCTWPPSRWRTTATTRVNPPASTRWEHTRGNTRVKCKVSSNYCVKILLHSTCVKVSAIRVTLSWVRRSKVLCINKTGQIKTRTDLASDLRYDRYPAVEITCIYLWSPA